MVKNAILVVALCLFTVTSARAQTNTVPTNAPAAVAIELVYDGSGSMADTVLGLNGAATRKDMIASNAVNSIAERIDEFAKTRHAIVLAGLVPFYSGDVQSGIPLQRFNVARFHFWTKNLPVSSGGTPLGSAIQRAADQLAKASASKKFILVITDGESNSGPSPERVLAGIKASQPGIASFFVAFDVDASVFNGAKTQGATIVSASDARQLITQVDNLLGQKILLEAE